MQRPATGGLTIAVLAAFGLPGCDDGGGETPAPDPQHAVATTASPEGPDAGNAGPTPADVRLARLQETYLEAAQDSPAMGPVLVRLHEQASLYPDHAPSRLLLAQALLSAGEVAAAHEAFERAVELRPDEPRWRELAGAVASQAGDLDAAEAHFRRAMELSPTDPRPRLLLADVLADTGRSDQAEVMLIEALEIDDGLHQANHALAVLALDEGRFVDARSWARRAMEGVGDGERNAAARRRAYAVTLARVLRAENRPEDALSVLRSIEPAEERLDAGVLAMLAECYASLGRPAAAARVYEQALFSRPGELSLAEHAARWHVEAGNLDAARDLRRHAHRLAPAAPETRRIIELIAEADADAEGAG